MYRRTTGRVVKVSEDMLEVKIKIPMSYKNRNYVGSIFGGSMLSATDPIYIIQLMHILGNNYVVWDKEASIKYRRPAKESIFGEFVFTQEEIESIKKDIIQKKEIDLLKSMSLVTLNSKVIAEISKTIYIADKSYYKEKRKNK